MDIIIPPCMLLLLWIEAVKNAINPAAARLERPVSLLHARGMAATYAAAGLIALHWPLIDAALISGSRRHFDRLRRPRRDATLMMMLLRHNSLLLLPLRPLHTLRRVSK